MEQKINLQSMGVSILTEKQFQEHEDEIDLGPLADLKGTWESPKPKAPIEQSTPITPGLVNGWNIIAVPDEEKGFVLEVMPYWETLRFCPVVTAGNRGYGVQQFITGFLYEQTVFSASGTELSKARNFSFGTEIHAETGLILYMTNENLDFSLARLSTIPHGNSVLALGNSNSTNPDDEKLDFGQAIITPTGVGKKIGVVGYAEGQYNANQFEGFPQQGLRDPNTFLNFTLNNAVVEDMTTLSFSTQNEGDTNSGILNIPFVTRQADTTKMTSVFWIEKIKGQSALQLQYSQTIDLVFPPRPGGHPVVWPHVTINTLTKVSDKCNPIH